MRKKNLFITRKEVADLLKVTLPTTYSWERQGKLKSYQIGRTVRFKEDEVLNALKERRVA
jgi:excisionase family DNA binding protein